MQTLPEKNIYIFLGVILHSTENAEKSKANLSACVYTLYSNKTLLPVTVEMCLVQ